MRILNIPEITVPTGAATPAPASPSRDPERVVALENVAKSALEKIQALEARVRALEQTQKAAIPTPEPSVKPVPQATPIPLAAISVDTEAVKKQLLEKMWKYLNDERLPKAI
jgi:hypothetical protein